MQNNKIGGMTERIYALADCAKMGEVLADIGTDHGYLPAYMLREHLIKKAVLTDINKGPLDNAKRTFAGMATRDAACCADFRIGDGLSPIEPGEADVCVIAGMGGELIAGILAAEPLVANSIGYFVLQPRSRTAALRRWLYDNRYYVIQENIVMERGRFCEIITCSPTSRVNAESPDTCGRIYTPTGSNVCAEMELFEESRGKPLYLEGETEQFLAFEIGSVLMHDRPPLFEEFVRNKIAVMKRISASAACGGADETAAQAYEKVKALEELLVEWRKK